MKKLILLLVMMLLCLGLSSTAYAGSINSNEQAVLGAAEGTYTYQGAQYRLDSSYISQLKEYLMSDDVDLTAVQRDKALSSVNSYIEQGVKEHYLVPVNGKPGQQSKDSGSGSNSSGNTQGSKSQTSTSSDTSTDEKHVSSNSGTDTSQSDIADEDTIKIDRTQAGNEDKNSLVSDNVGKSSSQKKSKSDVDKFMKDVFTENNEITTKSSDKTTDGKNSSIKSRKDGITAEQNNAADNDNTAKRVIKDTGFDFSSTLFVTVLMIIILIAAIIVAIRYRYFAQIEES